MLNTIFGKHFHLDIPVIQAPMAGVSTPLLAAQICNNGAIGSLGLGASSPSDASRAITVLRELTTRPFNINFFCHKPCHLDKDVEKKWLNELDPLFQRFGETPPQSLHEIYRSFNSDEELFKLVIMEKPPIASFHFGLPDVGKINRMKQAGIYLIASATNLDEAIAIEKAGFDAIIAQGYEAGGHRGIFDENSVDSCLSLFQLVKIILKQVNIPVIAAGGIMNGHDIATFIGLGASAVQMGTAFIGCPESQADIGYRQTLASQSAYHTVMTKTFSGRPARALSNQFTRHMAKQPEDIVPPYPYAYEAVKILNQIASLQGDFSYGTFWAGQGAPFSRPMKADLLIDCLKQEYRDAYKILTATTSTLSRH